MSSTWIVVKRGALNGLTVSWELAKVVIPVYFAVAVLQYMGVLGWLAGYLEPIMRYLGLPGEAALPIILGYTVNIYAAIGAVLPLGLTTQQITVIAAM
ncbi:MAG: nucleoside recognition domain-containing protein, partial [Syntrophomonadaceae bacterium]|nr:nucleoside recognition domain-containing protein [Syntrophomonadaceae bacterium]